MSETLVEKEMGGDTVRLIYREDAIMSFVLEVNGNRVELSNRPDEIIEALEERYGEGEYEEWFRAAPPFKDFDTLDLI